MLSSFRRTPRGGAESEQMEELSNMVSSVTFSGGIDRWSWSLVGDGEFSIASATKHIDESLCLSEGMPTRWTPGNPTFTLDTVFQTSPQPLLTLPTTELTTPPPLEIQAEGSSSTKIDDQQLQPEAERKGSKVQLYNATSYNVN
nr:RNA-directed DNA polymerase, eukaryota [Tanacetum cinerariifolium]